MKRLELRPGFVALACLSFYLWPGRGFRAWALLCALHEMGHLAALALCGVRVERLRLRVLGAVIETGPCANRDEALCALAGPAVNLIICFALRRCCPGAALLSLAIALCNLLPVYPLDGGRALRAVCGQYLPLGAVNAVDSAVSVCVLAALGLCAIRLVRSFGLLPVWAWALLLTHAAAERNLLLPRRAWSDIM